MAREQNLKLSNSLWIASSFFLEQNNRIFQTLSEVAGSPDPTLTQESVRAMGLDPHGDRLFLLHLLEIYGYDTLLVSEQLCCSWEMSRMEESSFACYTTGFLAMLSPQTFGIILLCCIATLCFLFTVALLLHFKECDLMQPPDSLDQMPLQFPLNTTTFE